MKIRTKLVAAFCTSFVLAIASIVVAQDEAPKQTLFTNVNVFSTLR